MELAEKVLAGEMRAVARAISHIENDHTQKEELIDTLYPHCGKAAVWGLTGPPGSGKSSLLDHIIDRERKRGSTVAVIAVDPSSPFSGGAILGDRLRMQKHATDSGVFIRSMASRGHLGGVAGATADVIKVLDAAGFDLIIIETIGVGQTEIDVVEMADVVLLLLVPGLGDEIQALKAGVMEIGDIFIINKSDRDDADKVRAEVEYVLGLKYTDDDDERNPVFMTSAKLNEGIDEMLAGVHAYFDKISNNGWLEQKRKKRIASEIKTILTAKIKNEVERYLREDNLLEHWVEQIYKGRRSPYAMINEKLQSFAWEYHSK